MGPRCLFAATCLIVVTFTIKNAVEISVQQELTKQQIKRYLDSNLDGLKSEEVENPDGLSTHVSNVEHGWIEDKLGRDGVENMYKIRLVGKKKHEDGAEERVEVVAPPHPPLQTAQPVVENEKPSVILITNGTQGFDDLREGDIEFTNCPQLTPDMKCEWSQSHGDSYLTTSDVVIFSPFKLHRGDYTPTHHPQHQKWVFFEVESPFRTWFKYKMEMEFWNSFNISVLFTEDADLVHTPFAFQCVTDPLYKPHPKFIFNHARRKTGGILWMVGNCNFTSGREAYVKEMQKYIDIDIYGHCGKNLICGEFGELHHRCVKRFIGRYKFYLAYENSFCDNYYTEKLTRLIGVDTIPVVMGLVNYTSILTPGTFIDVRDFSSPRALSEYLNYLSTNDTAFSDIIERKRATKCSEIFPNRYYCRLCHYLHVHRDEVQTIPDGRVWWGTKRRCQSKNAFFKGIADEII